MSKSITTSKIFWVNAVVVIVAAIGGAVGTDVIQTNPQLLTVLTAVVAGLNIVLRLFTSKAIR